MKTSNRVTSYDWSLLIAADYYSWWWTNSDNQGMFFLQFKSCLQRLTK